MAKDRCTCLGELRKGDVRLTVWRFWNSYENHLLAQPLEDLWQKNQMENRDTSRAMFVLMGQRDSLLLPVRRPDHMAISTRFQPLVNLRSTLGLYNDGRSSDAADWVV